MGKILLTYDQLCTTSPLELVKFVSQGPTVFFINVTMKNSRHVMSVYSVEVLDNLSKTIKNTNVCICTHTHTHTHAVTNTHTHTHKQTNTHRESL
jgi:hypothetical protein